MPFYSYSCKEHGSFDKMKKISEREFANCPECDTICSQSLTAPSMVMGGYMDTKMSLTNGNKRKALL